MVDEISELKILLNFIHSTKIPSQAEAAKKRIKEIIIQLKLKEIKEDFE